MPSQVVGYSVEPRLASFNDGGELAAQAAVAAAAAQQARSEFMKRFLPAKERRAPLEGFEDMSGFLRTIDGIQKPRFG
ncbi:CBN-FLP-33 protein [Caenorhabditis brenneri]|uniref:CBN-FLP-33 protein n=1 Tax=Caenorhabditis brenneri TaxID=135651 RepID=G0MJ66_CAEBE|nr:CBN-FLP-33 protein [Caenorhabditis brenneri]